MERRAFTLIELLVVIAIIALLVSILVPTLQRAKDTAESVVCSTIMKGIATGMTFYLEDHRQRFPGWSFAPFYGLMLDERIGPESAVCPSGEATPADFPSVRYLWGGSNRSYSGNAYICYCGWEIVEDVTEPCETLLIVEENEESIDNEHFSVRANLWWNMIAERHLHGANMLFVDMHLEYWPWEDPRTGVFTGYNIREADNPDLDRINRAQCPPQVP